MMTLATYSEKRRNLFLLILVLLYSPRTTRCSDDKYGQNVNLVNPSTIKIDSFITYLFKSSLVTSDNVMNFAVDYEIDKYDRLESDDGDMVYYKHQDMISLIHFEAQSSIVIPHEQGKGINSRYLRLSRYKNKKQNLEYEINTKSNMRTEVTCQLREDNIEYPFLRKTILVSSHRKPIDGKHFKLFQIKGLAALLIHLHDFEISKYVETLSTIDGHYAIYQLSSSKFNLYEFLLYFEQSKKKSSQVSNQFESLKKIIVLGKKKLEHEYIDYFFPTSFYYDIPYIEESMGILRQYNLKKISVNLEKELIKKEYLIPQSCNFDSSKYSELSEIGEADNDDNVNPIIKDTKLRLPNLDSSLGMSDNYLSTYVISIEMFDTFKASKSEYSFKIKEYYSADWNLNLKDEDSVKDDGRGINLDHMHLKLEIENIKNKKRSTRC